jgi:hypothetical protein
VSSPYPSGVSRSDKRGMGWEEEDCEEDSC